MADYLSLTQSQRVTIKLLSFFSGFIVLLLIFSMGINIYIIKQKDVIIQIPPVRISQNIAISSSLPNDDYFKTWALWLEPLVATFTPESIDENHQVLKSLLHPKRYDDISHELDKLSQDVKRNRVKEYFTANRKKTTLRVNQNFAEYTLVGSAERYVGGSNKEVRVKYTIKLYNEQGHFYIVGIQKEMQK